MIIWRGGTLECIMIIMACPGCWTCRRIVTRARQSNLKACMIEKFCPLPACVPEAMLLSIARCDAIDRGIIVIAVRRCWIRCRIITRTRSRSIETGRIHKFLPPLRRTGCVAATGCALRRSRLILKAEWHSPLPGNRFPMDLTLCRTSSAKFTR